MKSTFYLCLFLISSIAYGKNEHTLPNVLEECPSIVGKFEYQGEAGKEIWEIVRGIEPALDRLNTAVSFSKITYLNQTPPDGRLNFYAYYLDKNVNHYTSAKDSQYTYSYLALCNKQKLYYVGLKIKKYPDEVYWFSTRSFYLDAAGNLIQDYSKENPEKNWQDTLVKLTGSKSDLAGHEK